MARNYYTLVAGLREYSPDTEKKGFDAQAIRQEVESALSDRDRESLRLFYTFYDIENIINLRSGRNNFNTLGNFTEEELREEMKEPEKLPEFLIRILKAYNDPEDTDYDDIDRTIPIERSMLDAFYTECEKSGCDFLREWYEFDRNLRNVSAAYTARRLKLPVSESLVGEGYVVETLSKSSAADFGLRGELDYIDKVTDAVSGEQNLIEKEKTIDMIRWEMADDLTTFDYFDIDRILSYMAKVNIVQRWVALDPEYGREMFARLMESFTSSEMIDRAEKENEKQ